MIERNLGNAERVIRLVLGLGLMGWLIVQPTTNGIDWFVALVSLFLVLNGVFSRCYLWFVLDLNTYREDGETAAGEGVSRRQCS